jgi:hypothetical protein
MIDSLLKDPESFRRSYRDVIGEKTFEAFERILLLMRIGGLVEPNHIFVQEHCVALYWRINVEVSIVIGVYPNYIQVGCYPRNCFYKDVTKYSNDVSDDLFRVVRRIDRIFVNSLKREA